MFIDFFFRFVTSALLFDNRYVFLFCRVFFYQSSQQLGLYYDILFIVRTSALHPRSYIFRSNELYLSVVFFIL